MNDRFDRHFDAIERRLDWCLVLAGVKLGLTLANFGLLLTLTLHDEWSRCANSPGASSRAETETLFLGRPNPPWRACFRGGR